MWTVTQEFRFAIASFDSLPPNVADTFRTLCSALAGRLLLLEQRHEEAGQSDCDLPDSGQSLVSHTGEA